MLELKSDLKPREMISLKDRTRLTVYLALLFKIESILINSKCESKRELLLNQMRKNKPDEL